MNSKQNPRVGYDGGNSYSYFTDPIPEGERNDSLFEGRALYLAYRCFSSNEIPWDLMYLNENACEIPLDDQELQEIARSAVSYVDVVLLPPPVLPHPPFSILERTRPKN